jgi:tetratricopeptide (TPR) repeat protein
MTVRLLAALLLLPILGGSVAEGNRLYRAGQHRRAAEVYARLLEKGDSSAAVRYDLGTALLRTGRYDDARARLETAADGKARAPRELRMRAHYNAGNADLEPVFRGSVPKEQREQRLHRAVVRYRKALMLRPGDYDAKWNLELAQRLLERERRSGGGGGGQQNPKPSGGGGGGVPERPSPAARQPRPSPASRGEGSPGVSQARAERILSNAERQEREVQRRVLEKKRGGREAVRDW